MKRIGLLLCLLALPLSAATFTVTSSDDTGPGTLRQAILDVNALGAGPHTIAFNIAPGGLQTIRPQSALPLLTAGQTLLDGTTQPGYTGVPIIEITGHPQLSVLAALTIDGAGSRVRGLVINGFVGAAVWVRAPGVQVMNNYLGLDDDGTTGLGNGRGVLCIDGCSAIEIGNNVISGNVEGINIGNAQTGNVIRSNYIGTDATGMLPRGNMDGILWTQSEGRIGDSGSGGGNVISANTQRGVVVTGINFGASLINNRIGVAADGTTPLGNASDGVSLFSSALSVSENTIAHNLGHGVLVFGLGHVRNSIRGNRIFANRFFGISLGGMSPVPNDSGDPDGVGYANDLQNYPVLTSAVWNAGSLTVTGALNSLPGTPFLIDFYSNTACDPSGYGEGEVWRYTVQVTTDANGNAAFNANFAYPGAGFITATATNSETGDTSEFSQCRAATNAAASTVQFNAATASVTEGDLAIVTVTRSGSTAGPATVELLTSQGSASIPGDYLPPSTSFLFWNDGDGTPKTVSIPIVEDDMVELPEQFSVELRNATGATLGANAFAAITIEDKPVVPMPADLSIAISTRSAVAAQGGAIIYEIVAINNGPNNAAGATITNVLPPQLLFSDLRAPQGWTCTTPEIGASGTITCTATVLPAANGTTAQFLLITTVASNATGSIVNSASVSHLGTDPNPGNSSASSEATAIQIITADLSIAKTVDTARAAIGNAFMYTITVTNHGPDMASDVTLTDVLPPQLEYVILSVISNGTDFFCTRPQVYTNGTIACTAFRMDPGATATLRLHVRAAANATMGTVTNTATIASPTADPDSTDLTATAPGVELVAGADLSIHKHTATTNVRPNSIFNYTISVQNSGPNAATNVVITDVLPPDLLFEFAGPAGSFTCTTPPIGTNGTVTCTAPTLPASTVAGLSLRVRVAPGARPGVVENVATITSSTSDLDHDDTRAVSEQVAISAPAGVERRLDPGATGPRLPQVSPQVATTNDNALAVWREGAVPFATGGTASIRGALFRPKVDGETLIDFAAPEAGTDVAQPNVAAASDRYLVVWRESKSSQGRVLARRIRTDGSFIDAQPLVLDTGNAVVCCTDLGDPRPAVASDGRDFYVTWVSASYDVRGILVPGEGPVTDLPAIISRETDARSRGRFDLEVVWTSAMYVVVWLDRAIEAVLPVQPVVPRYARVSSDGVLLDSQSSNSIVGPPVSSITATSYAGGAVITVDYDDTSLGSHQACVGVVLVTASGEPADTLSLRCDFSPVVPPALHSTLVPVARGFLLVQPGRRYAPPFADVPIRTSSIDSDLFQLSDPTSLGVLAREVSVTNWGSGALLVYNRTDGDDPATRVPRVFAFLIEGQGYGRVRAVRH